MLQEKLSEDMKKAMRERNDIALSTIRMLRAAIMNTSIEKKKETLSDEEIYEVIAKQIKQRKDSIESFKKGGRNDLVVKEEAELLILEAYLPPQLSADELRPIVEAAIKELGVQSKKDMGRVMKEVLAKVKGRAEPRVVNEIVASLLH